MGVVTRELTKAPAPDLTAWALQMRERLVARAEETEDLRRLPQATIDETVEAGFFGMLTPTRFGGMGAGLGESWRWCAFSVAAASPAPGPCPSSPTTPG